ncbi:hypothetical protein [Klebsiella oxytoca]|uniref:hypothetical protein n=1 Tax=Klebsiella oxytoca TaxID=571 RepID=UPI001D4E1D58|nr:hypothetical protein [Klebsiella oxytoca]CAF2854680.1 hypothetical protein AI2945V1_1619 [Klebsiella oxytoca]CAF2865794.1 hypothetical protein AI2946V1_1618 [Klebsiella oxytoca]CAH5526137.1 hypothetical protein AI2946V1_1618 [Klebsiella oxytoca]CAH5600869.1 hypothetical protein AI2945V1_1619 [Klebsiella oxytoca]
MTSKLTRERIEQYANDPRMCNINDEIREMARIALAAMDSEPVAYMYDGEDGREYNGHNEFSGGGKGIPLYRHAQPAPASEPMAVTDDELNAALQLHRLKVDGHSQLSDAFRAGFKYARRTVPPETVSVPDFGGLTKCIVQRLVDYGAADDDSIASAEEFVYNACRAAMLQTQPICTCPSGDGSLRWPCPEHPRNSPAHSGLRPEQSGVPPAQDGNSPVIPDGLIAAVNRLLDSDGSRGCYSAIRCHEARAEVERLLAAAPQEVNHG